MRPTIRPEFGRSAVAKSDHPASSQTPRLDSLIRWMTWSIKIGMLAVPILLIMHFNGQLVMMTLPIFGAGSDKGFRATFDQLMSPSQSAGIVTGQDLDRPAQIARLRSMTARPEKTTGAATRVNFIAVAFEGKPQLSPSETASRHVVDRDGYRRMTLDLGRLPGEAVVVIADEPIRWTISGANSPWGLIGFEGLAPFDIVNGRADLLAGYRIAAFGARETARAADPFYADERRRRAMCASVRAWTDHFGVAMAQSAFALVTNPTSVGSSDGGITSDGQPHGRWTGSAIQSHCTR